MGGNQTSVIIVEDNEVLRLILESYIEESMECRLLCSYSNCEEAIPAIKDLKPDIVLMDIDLPGINGVEGTRRIKKISVSTQVIIVTVFENSDTVFSALSAGASGYLTKTFNKIQLLNAIIECVNGGAPMTTKIAKMVVDSFNKTMGSSLTSREFSVLTELARGLSYNSIADKLEISLSTVKFHIKNIYIKLEASTKQEALRIARDKRYI